MRISLCRTPVLVLGLAVFACNSAQAQVAPPAATPPTPPVEEFAPLPLQSDQLKTDPPPMPTPAAEAQIPDDKNEYKSNWRQAGEGEDGLGNRLRSHIVRLNEENEITGKITLIESVTGDLTPIEQVRIRFVRKGAVKAITTPNRDGSFTVKDLEPGVHSMIAAGRDGFLAWSVNVQPKLSDVAKMPKLLRTRFLLQEVKTTLSIEAAAVPPSNFVPLKSLLRGYLPSEESTLYMDGVAIPEEMDGPPPIDAQKGTTLRHHQVRLTRDGRLLGRIRRLQPDSGRDLKIRQLNVFLLRNNENVGQEPVAPNGTFAFNDLRPGVYSMVAAGRDGFLAFSIDVLNPAQTEATLPRQESHLHTAAFRIDAAQLTIALDMALCPVEDLNAANLDAHTDGFAGEDAGGQLADNAPRGNAGGDFAGTPGMGGGPVGGGGVPPSGSLGLPGVLTSTAVGVGVASILDDDDGRRRASAASPGHTTNANTP